MKARNFFIVFAATLALVACSGKSSGTTTPKPQSGQFEPATIQNDEGGPVTITGKVAYTNPFFTEAVAEPLVILEDQAGFVDRNRGYLMPPASQVVGQITSDFYTSPFSYSISLPIEPAGGLRDVDEDGQTDTGVMVFTPAYWTNTFGSPTLEQRDLGGGGWSTAYAGTRTSEDAATEREYIGGKIVVYAPDDQQGFPSGFGADAKLFTKDDPIVGIPQGYTVVDMDSIPFTFDRSSQATIDLLEPAGAALDDFSQMSYIDAFDAMLAMMRKQYAFTDLKHMDWDALNAEFRPRFQAATDNNDELAYDLAMRDFTWSIPDGHVGITTDVPALDTQFAADTAGGLGMAIRETDDGRVIVNFLTPNGPAETAGIQLGAQITEVNGTPIDDAISAVIPWSSPFSTDHTRRLQQLRYVIRFPANSQVEVGYTNPGGSAKTVTLATSPERDSFTFSSFNAGITGTELPVEFKILDNGYGYAAIYSFFDNDVLTVQLWERMIKLMNDSQVPGLIIDLRSNGGGNGFLADQMAAYFYDDQIDLGTDAAWDESIQDFYVDPNTPELMYPPAADLRFHGKVAVLVSPNCSSACEFFAYDMTQQDRALIVGQYPTGGLAGSVKDFNMPGGISVRFPFIRHLDKDGNIIIEGVGVVPTVQVPVNEQTLLGGGDPILDAAVDALNKFTFDIDFDALSKLQGGVSLLDQLVNESYTDQQLMDPGTLTYTVSLKSSQQVIMGYVWCTKTEDQLTDNWGKMEFTFTLDNEDIPADQFSLQHLASADGPCNLLVALVSGFPLGDHHFVVDANYTADFNDGSNDYVAGHRISDYKITVVN